MPLHRFVFIVACVCSVFSTISFSAMSLGRAMGYAPDYQKGRLSAAKMFALLDRKPAVDVRSSSGRALVRGGTVWPLF